MPDTERRARLEDLCATLGVTAPPPILLSTAQVAEWLGCSPDALDKWRTAGTGPRWIRIARTTGGRSKRDLRAIPRYRTADVEAWLREQERSGPTVPARRARRRK